MDFRFHEQVVEQLKLRGIKTFDLKADAGAVKYLISSEKPAVRDWILENIEIARRLHHINAVILINHLDCGAYGGSASFQSKSEELKFHTEQLKQAKMIVGASFPDLKVGIMFAWLEDGQVTLKEL
ncbi:MAG: hypothetical protein UW45_C0041G0010 [Parcubacteria group bacterium GW2011_GWC2_44_22]|nr:MAG: hypothetical protein UW45_C0041G0010 [Parcubacteria group bacterium GW2011_GWC2_44_22]